MRSWRTFVHVGRCDGSVVPRLFNHLVDLLGGGNVGLGQVLDEDASFLVWSDLQVVLVQVDQVSEFLHVQLNQWNFDSEFYVFSAGSDRLENVLDHSRNDAWFNCQVRTDDLTLHRVRFSGRCLTVCENCAVETLNYTVHDWGSRIVVNLLLLSLRVKDFVEGEFQRVFQILNFRGADGDCFIIEELMRVWGSQCFLSLIDGSEPTNDFNIGSCSNLLWIWHISISLNSKLFYYRCT